MDPTEAPNQLLNAIDAAVRQTLRPTSLMGLRYDQSHEFFEQSSSQQACIRDWLLDLVNTLHTDRERLRVLSVGCGSGIFDNPFIKVMDQLSVPIEYVAVEPNDVACQRFQAEFDRMETPNVQLKLLRHGIETLRSVGQFDLIHVVHSLYYFDDPAATIDALQELRAQDGHLVIVQAPEEELNKMANCFWQHHAENSVWFSQRLAEHLSERGIPFDRQRIDGDVDVSCCFESGNSEGEMMLDFIVQSDTSTLGEETLRRCRDYLRAVSRVEEDRILVNHPADGFVISQ